MLAAYDKVMEIILPTLGPERRATYSPFLPIDLKTGIVLVTGPTGSGKEVMAQLIHHRSRDPHAPFLDINCGALPEHLVEAELFGYAKGAFTGADRAKDGLMALADGGSLSAKLLVAADGARSAIRERCNIQTVGWAYGQSGIVTTVEHERDHQGRAEEHFLPALSQPRLRPRDRPRHPGGASARRGQLGEGALLEQRCTAVQQHFQPACHVIGSGVDRTGRFVGQGKVRDRAGLSQEAHPGRIGFVHDRIARRDAHPTEGVDDLAEPAEVDHDGVVDANAIELAEKLAKGCASLSLSMSSLCLRPILGSVSSLSCLVEMVPAVL